MSERVKTFPNLTVTQTKHPADTRHRQRMSERVKTFTNLTVTQTKHLTDTRHWQTLSETVKTFPNLTVTQAKHPADTRHRQRLSERVKTFTNLTVTQTKHLTDTRHWQTLSETVKTFRKPHSHTDQTPYRHQTPTETVREGDTFPNLTVTQTNIGATLSKFLRKILRKFILGQSLTISGKTLTRHKFTLLTNSWFNDNVT